MASTNKRYRATYSLGDFEAVLNAISTGTCNTFWTPEPLLHTSANDFSPIGKIKPAGMITKTIQLDKVVEEGFDALINDKENQVKILVDVGAGLSSN